MRHLRYGRIILGSGDAPIRFPTEGLETGLICLNGGGTVKTGQGEFELGRYDALYVPRDAEVEVAAGEDGCDLAEVSAPVDKYYPIRLVRFQDVQQDPTLHFRAGGPASSRNLNILIG